MRAALLLILLAAAASAASTEKQFLSRTYTVDRIWKSMLGPHELSKVTLGNGGKPELLWVTGFRTEIVGADGTTPQKKEFMCHINLDFDAARHRQLFGFQKQFSERAFTLSQGQFSIKFPEGYALPVRSDEPFSLYTQVLNHNEKTGKFEVRHKVTVEYVKDSDLKKPMKPLYPTSGFVMALIAGKDGFFSEATPSEASKHASCDLGQHAPGAPMGTYNDPFGRKLTGHWVVKPGRETKHTLVTHIMNLPFDTTMHYAAAHMHPFAESLELRDLTADKTVYKTKVRGPKTGIGIDNIEYFSSAKGVPLYKDHDYELVSVYNNTSGENQDSMASMFLYLLDKEFKKPAL